MRAAWLTFALLACQARAAGTLPPAADRDLARDIFKGLIEINTTHAQGSTLAAQAIEHWLATAGFAADDLVFVAPADHPNKGNLVVRLRAKPARHPLPPVLFLGHLDVVEAKPEDWSVDPFKLTEQEGYFYGRGTIDMKDGDAALVESLIRLRREHFTPQRDLIVAFTADEEAGGDANGPAFLLQEHRALIEAGLVVNLDGGGGSLKAGKRQFMALGTSEKNYVTFTFETTSPGGHGSLPGPDNAIYRMGAALGRVEAAPFPVSLTATTRETFTRMAALETGARADDMRAVARQPPDAAAAERLSDNVGLNAQLRTTCVATLINGGHAENALPQRARATMQCRMLPGDTADHVLGVLSAVVHDPQVHITLDATPIISPESPPTADIVGKLTSLTHALWPGVLVIPTMATGFSDDRQTRNAGIPSYDMSGIWIDGDENRAHGRDERVAVQSFDESVEFTYRLLKVMAAR